MRAASSARLAALLAGLAVLGASTAARAEPSAADRAFQQGRDQLALGKYAEACTAFATSERLDPQQGTRFNIAQCDEKLGRLVAALAIYLDLAQHDANPARKVIAVKLAADLAARVAHIHLRVTHGAPDLVITLDGVDVTAAPDEIAVDVGMHVVVTSQAGASTRTPVEVRAEHADFEVQIDAVAPPPKRVDDPPVAAASPHRHRRSLVAFTVGGAALAAGMVVGVLAHRSWDNAQDADARHDISGANQLADQASTRGNVATGLFVLGGIGAVVGLTLYLTAARDEQATRVTATPVAGGGGAVVFAGRF